MVKVIGGEIRNTDPGFTRQGQNVEAGLIQQDCSQCWTIRNGTGLRDQILINRHHYRLMPVFERNAYQDRIGGKLAPLVLPATVRVGADSFRESESGF